MNTNFCTQIRFLAMLLGAVTMAAQLQAVPARNFAKDPNPLHKEKIRTATSLEGAVARLKSKAKNVKDPQLQKIIREALKSAAQVGRAGKNATLETTKNALSSVQKVIAVLGAQKQQTHLHSSSSSSCDACSDLSELASDFEECCEDIKHELTELLEFLQTQFPCEMTKVINTVPVIISESGKYCVTTDLVYNGPNTAILVTADNVTINFHNHSLTLTNNLAQGIVAQDVSEFTLENDIIQGSTIFQTATSAAVHLVRVNKATLKNLYTKNTTRGIFIEDSTDIEVLHSLLEAHESSDLTPPPSTTASFLVLGSGNGAGIWIAGSTGVTVDACTFQSATIENYNPFRTNTAIHVELASENISIFNSSFFDWFCTINVLQVEGLLIDHCVVKANIFSSFHFVQLGDCDETHTANDAIIRNSTFKKYPTEVIDFDGILLANGAGCLIENVVVDSSSFGTEGYSAAALHIGIAECALYSNVLVRQSIIKGFNTNTLYIDAGRNVTVENSQLSSFFRTVEMRDAAACVVKDCVISGGEVGVYLNTTGKNAIMNCQIFNCSTVGINVVDSAGNHISGNSVYNNSTGISFPSGTPVEAYFNTACNNSTNCINVDSAQNPGDYPALAGSNICCNSEGT